ncbi:hypothetical protein U0070_005881 [Myodes glareolus]|uniref:Uncharacterized protein n=1 Tax=Myodes glareolus TaxID=447135 RepID=A0AAW0IJD6_MYOGA
MSRNSDFVVFCGRWLCRPALGLKESLGVRKSIDLHKHWVLFQYLVVQSREWRWRNYVAAIIQPVKIKWNYTTNNLLYFRSSGKTREERPKRRVCCGAQTQAPTSLLASALVEP